MVFPTCSIWQASKQLIIFFQTDKVKQMAIFGMTKSLMKKLDLFSSMQFLRFRKDAETKTLTGGFISFSIIAYLVITFSRMMLDTFNKVLIYSLTDSNQANEPPAIVYSTYNGGKRFMLGIELWGYDLSHGPRYFDITVSNSVLVQGILNEQTVDYKLQPCTKVHWGGLDNIDVLYERVGIDRWLCLPLDINITVSGKYSSQIQKSLDIVVSKCKNETDPSRFCASPQEIDQFMKSDAQLYWSPYLLNPLINPLSSDYLSYYLQDKYEIMSGPNYGAELYIYSNDFQITTDESILPFPSQHIDTGPIISSVTSNTYMLENTTDVYCLMSFVRGPQSLIITRAYEKIIDAFAYIGGLLGSFLLLLIIVNFYNEQSFQMNFAEALYHPEEGSPTTFRKYNIFFYVLQTIYSFLKRLKIKLNWERVSFFHKTREEMVKQLDVLYLFKKIHILESAMVLLFSKHQLRGLMLKHEMTVSEVRGIRKMYSFKKEMARLLFRRGERQRVEEEIRAAMSPMGEPSSPSVQSVFKMPMSRGQDNLVANSEVNGGDHMSLRLQDFGSDSDSSNEDEEQYHEEDQLLEDIKKLQQQSLQRNQISQAIFNDIDPRIKKALEQSVGISFEPNHQRSIIEKPIRQMVEMSAESYSDSDNELQCSKLRVIKSRKNKRKHDEKWVSDMKEPSEGGCSHNSVIKD